MSPTELGRSLGRDRFAAYLLCPGGRGVDQTATGWWSARGSQNASP